MEEEELSELSKQLAADEKVAAQEMEASRIQVFELWNRLNFATAQRRSIKRAEDREKAEERATRNRAAARIARQAQEEKMHQRALELEERKVRAAAVIAQHRDAELAQLPDAATLEKEEKAWRVREASAQRYENAFRQRESSEPPLQTEPHAAQISNYQLYPPDGIEARTVRAIASDPNVLDYPERYGYLRKRPDSNKYTKSSDLRAIEPFRLSNTQLGTDARSTLKKVQKPIPDPFNVGAQIPPHAGPLQRARWVSPPPHEASPTRPFAGYTCQPQTYSEVSFPRLPRRFRPPVQMPVNQPEAQRGRSEIRRVQGPPVPPGVSTGRPLSITPPSQSPSRSVVRLPPPPAVRPRESSATRRVDTSPARSMAGTTARAADGSRQTPIQETLRGQGGTNRARSRGHQPSGRRGRGRAARGERGGGRGGGASEERGGGSGQGPRGRPGTRGRRGALWTDPDAPRRGGTGQR